MDILYETPKTAKMPAYQIIARAPTRASAKKAAIWEYNNLLTKQKLPPVDDLPENTTNHVETNQNQEISP